MNFNTEYAQTAKRFYSAKDKVDANIMRIIAGIGYTTESEVRLGNYINRHPELASTSRLTPSPEFVERIIGSSNDMLSIEFLELGLLAAKSIGKLTNGLQYGTGFLIGNNVIITNNHVLPNLDAAINFSFELNYEENKVGTPKNSVVYNLNPSRFFYTDSDLDFTVVALSDDTDFPLENFGWHSLLEEQGKTLIGQAINIIHHPQGGTKKVSLHNSNLLHLEDGPMRLDNFDNFCFYSGDTLEGISGAPVFNNQWEIIALHHSGVPRQNIAEDYLDKAGNVTNSPLDYAFIANEGIRISKIVSAIKHANFSNQEHGNIRDELINLWNSPGAHRRGLKRAEQAPDF